MPGVVTITSKIYLFMFTEEKTFVTVPFDWKNYESRKITLTMSEKVL